MRETRPSLKPWPFKVGQIWSGQRDRFRPDSDWKFSESDLYDYYLSICRGNESWGCIPSAACGSDRPIDRARQLLRKAGLIEFDKEAGWRQVVEEGTDERHT